MKTTSIITIYIFFTLLCSCKKNITNFEAPNLKISASSIFGATGDIIWFSIYTEVGCLPAHLSVIPSHKGLNEDCFLDTLIETNRFKYTYLYKIDGTSYGKNHFVTFEFKVVQSDKQEAIKNIEIHVDEAIAPTISYYEELYNALDCSKDSV